MNSYKYIRPLLMCASTIALMGCSYQSASDMPPVASDFSASRAQSAGGLKAIADDLATNGQHEAAIPLYRHLGARSGDPAVLSALANSLSARGAHEEAVRILTTLGARGQMDGNSWYTLGKTNLALGQFEDALSAFDQARAYAPGDTKILSGLAISEAALGRTGDAMNTLAVVADPTGLSNRALLYATTGHPEVAVSILEPMVKAGMLGPQGRQNLAMAYLLDGRESDAFKIARLDLDPETIGDTFTFYRSLSSLAPSERMQALVTGTIDPSWTRDEAANLQIADSTDRQEAAKRLMEKPVMMAKAPEPEPEPETEPVVAQADYELTEIPPLVEPEGWALQIGAYRTIENLMRGWTILYRQSGDLLQDIPPRRSEVDFGDRDTDPKGFYYRLNAGPLKTLKQAKDLCKELRARGTSCWIRPPEKTEGSLPEETSATKKPSATTTQTASLG
ncbi:tetratricopeptide repeat protein [Kordiimonas lipolytica]|uniref:Tetratricopeptide repeat protein n=1 Tax=Kordiimonas lipolytica TaxID=1662421 RepID=A0ABV8U6G6_9PROT|nr:SPOR domain-containing protein [Kordiimonas lipolytica]